MRMYVKAESEKGIGYLPDWLKVQYEKNGQTLELTLDIIGETNFNESTLDCRCKTDIVPWTLVNLETGEETDLSGLSEEEVKKLFTLEMLANIICNSSTYRVGIFPVDNTDETIELAMNDVLSKGEGFIEIFDSVTTHEKHFEFETELNV